MDYEYTRIDSETSRIDTVDICGSWKISVRTFYPGISMEPHPYASATLDSASMNIRSVVTVPVARGENKAAQDNSTRALHQGVKCDECGMFPIEGPRFMSTTRYNYDLCHHCLETSGSNIDEYQRFDQRFICHRHRLASTVWPHSHLAWPFLRQRASSSSSSTVRQSLSCMFAISVSDCRPRNSPRKNVIEVPVIFSSEEVDIPVYIQTRAGIQNIPSMEIGTRNVSGKTSAEEMDVQSPVLVEGEIYTEEDLAAKLATMGFEDLKLTLDDLCAAEEWDPILEELNDLCATEEWDPILGELQELGFYDANMNRPPRD